MNFDKNKNEIAVVIVLILFLKPFLLSVKHKAMTSLISGKRSEIFCVS